VQEFVAPQVVSGDQTVIEKTYNDALAAGHEGIMIKVRDSPYTPGQRGKNWIKIKPEVDTLDLAVIGAEWGEGKRAHVFGSFLVACQDQGKLVPLSRVATGFSDDQLAEVYELLKDTVISRSGKEVQFEPELVFEVGYAELQVSPTYAAGFALRFPGSSGCGTTRTPPRSRPSTALRNATAGSRNLRRRIPDNANALKREKRPLRAQLGNERAVLLPVRKTDTSGGHTDCLFERFARHIWRRHRFPCGLTDHPGTERRPVLAGDCGGERLPGPSAGSR